MVVSWASDTRTFQHHILCGFYTDTYGQILYEGSKDILCELAQLRQVGTPEAYIAEFEKVVVQVIDISEHRLVVLFKEGLAKPLCGWVKDFIPTTL